jgi:hypothetical protein
MRALYFEGKSKIVKNIRQPQILFIRNLKPFYLTKDIFLL